MPKAKKFYDKYHADDRKLSLRYEIVGNLAKSFVSGKSVFEVGCGCGENAAMLAQVASSWKGVDLYPVAIEKAIFRAQLADFMVGDFMEMEIGEGPLYDAVCFFDSLEHFPEWREALQKGMDICKIGGKILINIPAPNWTKWASDHRYYLKDYREQDPDHQISLEDIMFEARSRGMEILCYYLYKCDVPQQYQFIVLGSKIEWEILNEGIKSNAVQQQLAGVL